MSNNNQFIMSPTNDFCFKELMQNPKVRKGFISCILKKSPEEIAETILMPTETKRDYADDKLSVLDVKILLADGTKMDLEMQVAYFGSWDKRVLFYLTKMYTEQIRKGEDYEKLKKCVHVGILDFVRFPESDECYHKINLCNCKNGEIYTDLLELHILELPKLPAARAKLAHGEMISDELVIRWMEFFSGKTQEDFETMAKQDEYIEEAVNTIFELSADEQKRLEYEAREKAIRDDRARRNWAIKTGLEEGRKQGLKQGLEQGLTQGLEQGLTQGRAEGLALAARIIQLKQSGKTLEEISTDCGLSLEQVKGILGE